jgi:hypothetical protein
MKLLFGFQDVLEIVDSGYEALVENATESQRKEHEELKKKDYKALFFIQQLMCESFNL